MLIENQKKDTRLCCEHGLSLFIEHHHQCILLDAGQTGDFLKNATRLGKDLGQLKVAVLSHGHYDHAGGFAALLKENSQLLIYAHQDSYGTFLSGKTHEKEIGIPNQVKAYASQFQFSAEIKEILPDIFLVPHTTEGLEKIGEEKHLYQKIDNSIVPDNFSHEQSLVVVTEKGVVIFNSCSHGGVKNIILEVKQGLLSQGIEKPIVAYVGGFHMKQMVNQQEICTFSEKELDELCEFLKEEKIEKIYTGHCTGEVGYGKLKERLPEMIFPMHTGMEIEL